MKKKITFIEVIIVIVVIVVIVKGYQFWNKPEGVSAVTPVPTEISIGEPTLKAEKSITPTSPVLPTPFAENPTTSPCPHITPEMVLIKGGIFQMGSTGAVTNPLYVDEFPQHEVNITKDFYMGKYEVTNNEYVDFLNNVGNQKGPGGKTWIDMNGDSTYAGIEFITAPTDSNAPNIGNFKVKIDFKNRPVVYVTWYGVVAYCNWLSEQEGFTPVYDRVDPNSEDLVNWITRDGYRLPTEAEWEYACRGGTDTKYYWGDEMDGAYCWYRYNSEGNSHEVGQKEPNGYGLYDMSGNVSERCNDRYDKNYYSASPYSNPTGPSLGSVRVMRGGSWYTATDTCRSVNRGYTSVGTKHYALGFRVARSAP